jgi:hypothetical protein
MLQKRSASQARDVSEQANSAVFESSGTSLQHSVSTLTSYMPDAPVATSSGAPTLSVASSNPGQADGSTNKTITHILSSRWGHMQHTSTNDGPISSQGQELASLTSGLDQAADEAVLLAAQPDTSSTIHASEQTSIFGTMSPSTRQPCESLQHTRPCGSSEIVCRRTHFSC